MSDGGNDTVTRRTKAIVLTIIGAGLGLTAYNAFQSEPSASETRNVYGSKEDCESANKPSDCEPAAGRGGYSHGHYFGPLFFPGQTAPAPVPPGTTTSDVRQPARPIGQYTSQRGGFGGTSGSYHSGS